MSETHEAVGTCLCGGVGIRTGAMSGSVGACHCGACRKWGGSPLLAVDCGSDVEIGPACYSFSRETTDMNGPEVFEKYAPGAGAE